MTDTEWLAVGAQRLFLAARHPIHCVAVLLRRCGSCGRSALCLCILLRAAAAAAAAAAPTWKREPFLEWMGRSAVRVELAADRGEQPRRRRRRKVRAKRGSTLTNQIRPTSKTLEVRRRRKEGRADWNCKIAAAAAEEGNLHHALRVFCRGRRRRNFIARDGRVRPVRRGVKGAGGA